MKKLLTTATLIAALAGCSSILSDSSYIVRLSSNPEQINNTTMMIGRAYLNGDGVSKNIDSALVWFNIGIEAADEGSMYQMSKMYLNGIGVKKDIEKAVEHMEKACDMDYIAACEELGDLYYNGKEIKPDVKKSAEWYFRGVYLMGAKSHYCYSNYILMGYVGGSKSSALSYARKAKELGYDSVACDFLILNINAQMH